MPTDWSPPRVAVPPSGGRPKEKSSDDFAATIRFGGDEVIVYLGGELDVATAPSVRVLLNAVAEEGYERVVLDLAELSFLDASGINVIVAASKRLRLTEQLTLRSPSAITRRILHLTAVDALEQINGPDSRAVTIEPSSIRSRMPHAPAVTPSDEMVVAMFHLVAALARALTRADGVSVSLVRRGGS